MDQKENSDLIIQAIFTSRVEFLTTVDFWQAHKYRSPTVLCKQPHTPQVVPSRVHDVL